MLIKTKGIVLGSRSIGENDRMITILSKELGVIEASARQVKRLKSPLAAATQVISFSEFCIFRGKKYDSINTAELIESFYTLRLDVEKLSLACYFCDLTGFLTPHGENAWACLRFLLNTLSFLQRDQHDPALLKSVFELKILSMAGFMPDLTCCQSCGVYEAEKMIFYPLQATLLCDACDAQQGQQTIKFTLGTAVMYAMRHIIYADDNKIFSFRLQGNSLSQLSAVTEQYIAVQIEHTFRSLTVYKQLLSDRKIPT